MTPVETSWTHMMQNDVCHYAGLCHSKLSRLAGVSFGFHSCIVIDSKVAVKNRNVATNYYY